jgi:hypothetical protein
MSKVITTKEHGDILISPINAGSFHRGDMIAVGGEVPGWIADTQHIGHRPGYGMRVNLTIETACWDGTTTRYTCEYGLNEPQWLIVGGRSGGQI